MKRMLSTLILGVLLLVPASAFAGGWTQSKDSGYAKIWATGIFGAGLFDLDGEIVETESFRLALLSLYGEYGIKDDLTLVGMLQPVGVASYADQTRGYAGRMTLGFRQRFATKPLQFALEARFGGVPGFGGERDMAPDSDDFEFRPAVGTFLTEWELQVGRALGTVGWITASLGPRWHMNPELSPVLQGFLQVGFGPFGGFIADVHFSFNHSFDAPEFVNVTGASNTRYLGPGIGLSYWFTDNFAVNLTGDGAIYAISNAAAPALSLGVELKN